MIRIAFLFALVSTSAIACESYDWKCQFGEDLERNEQRRAIEQANRDADYRHVQNMIEQERIHEDNMIVQRGIQQSIDMQPTYNGGYGSGRW